MSRKRVFHSVLRRTDLGQKMICSFSDIQMPPGPSHSLRQLKRHSMAPCGNTSKKLLLNQLVFGEFQSHPSGDLARPKSEQNRPCDHQSPLTMKRCPRGEVHLVLGQPVGSGLREGSKVSCQEKVFKSSVPGPLLLHIHGPKSYSGSCECVSILLSHPFHTHTACVSLSHEFQLQLYSSEGKVREDIK